MKSIETFGPGDFEPERHFYPRVLNAQIHPLVRHFFQLGPERIAERYAHLHPGTDRGAISKLIRSPTKNFCWGGADLFLTTDDAGLRQVVVIETNSCPSGQKSMPLLNEADELGSYRQLIERAFLPQVPKRARGSLCVLFDKNEMEASGYAAALAEITGEEVLLVPAFANQEAHHRVDEGQLIVRHQDKDVAIRGAIRYVTQRPWTRLPPITKTFILNPVIACLAGGRNKAVAAKAYDLFNAEMSEEGLHIRTPETFWDVGLEEIPMWVSRMGGVAVVKDPYSNAGQGVYTITNPIELKAFMDLEHRYDRFIVQALIGNRSWTSRTGRGERLYHVGTIPNKRMQIFVSDLRFMVGSGPDGFFPVGMYARRARSPLLPELPGGESSWDMLGTNLSVRTPEGEWSTETGRLLLFDNRDFNQLGIGVDDLIEAFLQTVMSVTAIDRMTQRLTTQKGVFRRKFFRQLNPDAALAAEIL